MKPIGDELRVPMRYGELLAKGKFLNNGEVVYIRAQNDGILRWLFGSPPSSGGAVSKPGRIVPALAAGARARQLGLRGVDIASVPDGAAYYVMSAVFLAKMVRDLGHAFKDVINNPVGGAAVTPGTPGVPANQLPGGTEWRHGPCQSWGNSPQPVPVGGNVVTPCFSTTSYPDDYPTYTDAETSAILSSGLVVNMKALTATLGDGKETWRSYGTMWNPTGSPVTFDSSIHGLAQPKPAVPGNPYLYPGNSFIELLDRLGYPRPNFPLAQVPARMVGNSYRINKQALLKYLRELARLWRPPPLPPKPPVIYPPERPFDPNVRTIRRYTPQMRRVSRVVGKAGKGVKESKGNIAKAVSHALDVMGALSEVADDLDALYKSLPASIRKRAYIDKGKSLDWQEKATVIWYNIDSIDIKKFAAGLITTRVDDYVASQIARPLDKALQVAVPDYLTRLGVRQAIRWAYWTSGQKSPIPQAPSSQRLLPKEYQQELVSKRHQNY